MASSFNEDNLVRCYLWKCACNDGFWHHVRCKLRLHFARLFAVRGIELVALCAPGFTVKVAVTYGLGYVLELDVLAAFKVGYGAGDLEYAVICTCREVEPCHRGL